MMSAFEADPRVTLVLSNGDLIDSNGRLLSQQLNSNRRFQSGVISNIIRNGYQGSTMAFRRGILNAALPFPDGIPMHDSWIGLVNAVIGRTEYLHDKLLLYRRHESNVTARAHGTVVRMFTQRLALVKNLICRMGAMASVRRTMDSRTGSLESTTANAKIRSKVQRTSPHGRAVVFAPFFSCDETESRPRFVGSVLAELMPIDVVTSDFDHSRKAKRERQKYPPFDQVIYIETLPYYSNVSLDRLILASAVFLLRLPHTSERIATNTMLYTRPCR